MGYTSMSLKAYLMPKHCLALYDTIKQSFITLHCSDHFIFHLTICKVELCSPCFKVIKVVFYWTILHFLPEPSKSGPLLCQHKGLNEINEEAGLSTVFTLSFSHTPSECCLNRCTMISRFTNVWMKNIELVFLRYTVELQYFQMPKSPVHFDKNNMLQNSQCTYIYIQR